MTTPRSAPRPRPTWREPRFLLGVALVLVSILAVAGLVAASDHTVPAFVARHTLAPGDELGAADLRPVRVRLDSAGAVYLVSAPRAGTAVTRTVGRGELVPLGALSVASARRQTSMVIAVAGQLPAAVDVGAMVDVWAAAASGQRAGAPKFEVPRVLVAGAAVARVVRNNSGLGANGSGLAVEVRVPKEATARLLEAVANGADITLVPVGG